MIWEWEHHSTGGQWILSVAAWQAVVQRLAGPRPLWQATLTRTTVPEEQYTSSVYLDALEARTWCLRTIAVLVMDSHLAFLQFVVQYAAGAVGFVDKEWLSLELAPALLQGARN